MNIRKSLLAVALAGSFAVPLTVQAASVSLKSMLRRRHRLSNKRRSARVTSTPLGIGDGKSRATSTSGSRANTCPSGVANIGSRTSGAKTMAATLFNEGHWERDK